MTRRVLPQRRQHDTFRFDHEGLRYYASVSYFDDGSLAELFLNAGKAGTAVQVISRDAAVVFSLALQFGVPEKTLAEALQKLDDQNSAGPLGIVLEHVEKMRKGDAGVGADLKLVE